MDKTQRTADAPTGGPMSAKIDYEEVRKLIALLEEKNLALFELEVEGFKIKISRAISAPAPLAVVSAAAPAAPSANPGTAAATVPLPDPGEAMRSAHYVNSPMVGTFYRRPDPTSDPFVEEGDHVKKGQTLCIIEAMKLMNEIESDIDGVVAEILVENAKPVEFGQRLFGITPLP